MLQYHLIFTMDHSNMNGEEIEFREIKKHSYGHVAFE